MVLTCVSGSLEGLSTRCNLGHLALAAGAREQLGLQQVVFIPAGQPWLKAGLPVTDARHRMEMVRLAICGEPSYCLSEIEVQRSGPTYTVDTLEELSVGLDQEDELYLILGMDALEHFHRWKEPERILELCRLAVALRAGDTGYTVERFLEMFPGAAALVNELPVELPSISSTEIRTRAAEGETLDGMVPAAVAEYIRRSGLYRREVESNAGRHSGRE